MSETAMPQGEHKRRYERQRSLFHRERLRALKEERGCERCGYNESHLALEFDHLPGFEKRKEVSKMYRYSWESVLAEVAKCQILCSNCHKIVTHERRPPRIDD